MTKKTPYRIADAHTHIYPSKIAEKAVQAIGDFYDIPMTGAGTADALVCAGAQCGVERYLVCSVATKPEQAESITRFIAEECAAHPEFVGVGAYHQDLADPAAHLDLIQSLGLSGIKLHSDFQRCDIDDPRLMPVYEMLQERGMFVMFHMGDDRYDFSAPKRLARVLEKYPDLRCHAAHFGGYQRWQEAMECLPDAGANLYFDTSSSLEFIEKEQALAMIEAFGAGRMMFGTDFPMWTHEKEIENVLSLGLTEKENKMIFYDNFARFFGIE